MRKKKFVIPENVARIDVAQGICAQANLRSGLWQARRAGYTDEQLRAEVERCIEFTSYLARSGASAKDGA